MRRARGDDGQLMLLIVFFGLVAALLTVVVIDASAAYLAHRDLAGVADGAALAAAQTVDLGAYYTGGPSTDLPLGDVAAAAAAYVERYAPAAELVSARLVDGGRAVHVVLRTRIRFALAASVFPDGAEIGAEATAVLTVR